MRWPARRDLLVLIGFAAISFAYFGWRLLPHPTQALVGTGQDPLIFVWSFAWWPHAILGWTNPFVTHALYAPTGINLAWTTSVPGLAIAFAPITLLFGPVVAYNLAAVLLPALAAWTAYLLCMHLTRSLWASIVGGYLFGFSSFILGQQLEGHLHLTGVFLVPLAALAAARFLEGGLSQRGFALRLGVLLALQLSISTETALTLTLMLALALALAACLVPEARPRVRALLPPLALAYGLAALLAAPLVVYALIGIPRQGFAGVAGSSTDLLNLIFPTGVNGLAGSSFHSLTSNFNELESALYLGPPALLIVALYAWRARRSPWGRFIVAALLCSVLIALGTKLRVDGHAILTLPLTLTRLVPGLDNLRLTRFAVYAALSAAVIVALWTAQTKGRIYPRPYLLPLLAIASLVPAVWQSLYLSHPERVAFFSAGLDGGCIPAGETLAVFPFGFAGDSQLWEAEAGFRFRLAEGYLSPTVRGARPLSSFDDDPTVSALAFLSFESRPTMDALLAFAGTHGVGRIVSVVAAGYPNRDQMRRFGPVEQIGGVLVSPACGRPPLTTVDLSRYVREASAQLGNEIGYCLGPDYYALPAEVYPAGILQGAKRALFSAGHGLGCTVPSGYKRHGLAAASLGVPANTYPYYAP